MDNYRLSYPKMSGCPC